MVLATNWLLNKTDGQLITNCYEIPGCYLIGENLKPFSLLANLLKLIINMKARY